MKLLLFILRKFYGKIFGLKIRTFSNRIPPQFTGQESSDLIYNKLNSKEPCMISRLGHTEFSCVYIYKLSQSNIMKKYLKYIIGDIDGFGYTPKMKHNIQHNAGFFPATDKNLDKFSKLILSDIKDIDILGSIIDYENEFIKELEGAIKIKFNDLNSFNHTDPWSKVLKEKKILIIHPFVKSIERQYKKRTLLFKNENVLPEFNLITYKPVQSIAGNFESLDFTNWFEALESMQQDISKINFDIAIIGCGAYGLPLAAFIKRMGKKSIHIGGGVQLLFGIIGRRWETEYNLSMYINDYWVRPDSSEKPNNFKDVENGCYW
ncbi:hypothetical protein [Lutibacter sp.]|uniref:hypothetical protein n=1 Tax=Lutibacter sp. TaxID=1925666 RepID=UPI0025C2DF39|nr:hypothetical protein [Lutibacter sp.]MCF6182628.1 hypothetical protein [Lutibacter sp.]